MRTLMERLLGSVAYAPPDDNGGGDDGNDGDPGAAGGGGGSGGDGGDAKPSAADIAARAGGAAFAGKKPDAEDAGSADGDGVDPASRPKDGPGSKRPEHVPEKFWNAEKGEMKGDDLAKAYTTLEANFTRLKADKGVPADVGDTPEAYLAEGIQLPDDVVLDRVAPIEANDPALEVFRKVAHKHKLPTTVAAGLAADFLTELNGHLPAPQTEADIIKELGPNGERMRDELGVWMEGQYNSGLWSGDELEWAYQTFGSSARGIRLLAKMREAAGERPIPIGQPLGEDTPSAEEWYAMNRDPRMKTDPAFREKVEKMGERIFGTDPAGSSQPGIGVSQSRGFDRRERGHTRA